MGMSSSQARLLALTGRMHDIEYKAQRIQAQKLQLANESDRVYDDYIRALDAKKTVAKILTNDGSMTYTDLTAGKIYNYNELMKQYALVTADGKTLIPETEHNNYKTTDSLSDFLEKYGLLSNYSQTVHHHDPNPAFTTAENNYETAHDNWEQGKEDAYNDWKTRHDNWETQEPDPSDPKYHTPTSMSAQFATACGSHYTSAVNGSASCYAHVLSSIIVTQDIWDSNRNQEFTTSVTNLKTRIYDDQFNCFDPRNNNETNRETLKKVRQFTLGGDSGTVNNSSTWLLVSDDCEDPNAKCNQKPTASSDDFTKLLSKYNTDGSKKTVRQWAIDLYYLCKNNSISGYNSTDLIASIKEFQQGLSSSLYDEEGYNRDHQNWVNSEPPLSYDPEPKKEDYTAGIEPYNDWDEKIDHTTFNDPSKAQWYINLWYKMEGENDVPQINQEVIHNDANDETVIIYSVDAKAKSSTTYGTEKTSGAVENDNYIVIPSAKLNDPGWVHNTLQEGFVLLQAFDRLNSKFYDTSTSVDTGVDTMPDEKELKKAEAQYEADMKRIDRKDAKYDTQLAKVDTERTAIKEEMETLKTVIKENGERTFKLFS